MASKQMISLDIGNSSIKAVLGRVKDGKAVITKAVIADIPANCYDNGVIKNQLEFGSALKAIIGKLDPKCKDIVVSYDGNEVIKRELIIPKVSPEDIDDLVSYEITNYLPIDITNYIMQHKVIRTTEDGKLEVRVTAVPVSVAQGLFSAIKDIGCNPTKLELSTNGIENIYKNSAQNIAVIDIGSKNSNVTIVERGNYIFNRLTSLGTNIFDHSLSGIMEDGDTIDKMRDSVKVAEIWHRYRSGGFSGVEMAEEERGFIDGVVLEMDELLEEIDKVIQFYLKREPGAHLDQIHIYGGGSTMASMPNAIQHRLGVPTSVLTLPGTEHIRKPELFVNAVTAITGEMNFFKPFIKVKKKSDPKRLVAAIICVVLLFGLLYITFDKISLESSYRAEIRGLQNQIDDPSLNEAIARVAEKEILLQKLMDLNTLIMSAHARYKVMNTVSDAMVNFINAQIPDKVFLKSITVDGTSVTIEGVAEDYENYAQFAYNLGETGKFKNIQMGTIENKEEGQLFKITMERVMGAIDEDR
ncbi:MAG: pilus assembly protein PilM [Bacillota bacterium]|nr:pilus assembly protein PilM [Bacillota bacterium]